jgi:hypothetical protein
LKTSADKTAMVMNQVSLTRRTRKNNAISAYSSANGGVNHNRLFKNQMDETNFHDITNLSSISRTEGLRNETSADSNNNETSKCSKNEQKVDNRCKPKLTIRVQSINNLHEIQSSKSKKMVKNNCSK